MNKLEFITPRRQQLSPSSSAFQLEQNSFDLNQQSRIPEEL
jgi:hypothetical protein